MFALGIPKRQYRRTTQVLGHQMSTPTNYDAVKQDDGFYLFTFPDADENEFKDLVNLLKRNGVTTIGADSQLTEKRIMKLADLIKPLHEEEDDKYSPFAAKARDYIEKFKQEYREMSDDGIDEFNKEIIEYLLDTFPSAQAAVLMRNAKNKSLYSDDELDKTDNLPFE
tara:strand:+ start:818 stop:1321 length:504 start_codon:yes stop_codon:yes gene_type:complete